MDLEREITRMENRKYNYTANLIYGSAAPKREYAEPRRKETAPVREPRHNEDSRQRAKEQYAAENRRRASGIGGLYTVFIAAAVAVTLFACVTYIQNINRRSEQAKEIAALEEQLTQMKEANDNRQIAIDTSVDFNYIYSVAVGELGMVHAKDDQVISYESGESEFVIQYTDVPAK